MADRNRRGLPWPTQSMSSDSRKASRSGISGVTATPRYVELSGANLRDANLYNAPSAQRSLDSADLSNVALCGADLNHATHGGLGACRSLSTRRGRGGALRLTPHRRHRPETSWRAARSDGSGAQPHQRQPRPASISGTNGRVRSGLRSMPFGAIVRPRQGGRHGLGEQSDHAPPRASRRELRPLTGGSLSARCY